MAVLKNREKQAKTINLKSGESYIIKNHMGFTVLEIDESGNVRHKGKMVKT